MLSAIAVIVGLALLFGALLAWAAQRFAVEQDPIIEQIERILPQTQCGQCNFPGCRPYAEAIAEGRADINQCPPGGDAGVRALAELLGREIKPLNAEHGEHKPARVALIVEAECIGCTKCIQACPVDAIIGAPKRMHTVIAELCTGCDLCVPPCPVDCIEMPERRPTPATWRAPKPAAPASQQPQPH
ncbi:MAG: electron transport complex subunit RsxB [Gammaproteobacteria bacterium HGW-Gammaproteobacteria-2]|jgi:electron transport complex protein RnfB|nr:MAG: electron transport complex subunit RsxB [Gammaproteobacteria bacterium HGW-Gammaproteobacteria-2]